MYPNKIYVYSYFTEINKLSVDDCVLCSQSYVKEFYLQATNVLKHKKKVLKRLNNEHKQNNDIYFRNEHKISIRFVRIFF